MQVLELQRRLECLQEPLTSADMTADGDPLCVGPGRGGEVLVGYMS